MDKMRNRVAHAVANWVLNTFGTPEYVQRLGFVYRVGMQELDRRLDTNEETS